MRFTYTLYDILREKRKTPGEVENFLIGNGEIKEKKYLALRLSSVGHVGQAEIKLE